MKIVKALVALVVATLVSSSVFAARTDNPTLRIMPLGDSITYGSCSEGGGGYRAPLWRLLTNGNYNVDFVGTQTSNPRKDGTLGDVDHEGHGGWKLSSPTVGVYENINGWFARIRDPHVILLHLGTNDTGDGEKTFCESATNRLVKLLDRIHACQPSAKIVVTTLLRRIGNSSNDQRREWIERAYNPYIEGIVAEQRAKGQDAYFLDMCGAVTDDGLYTDGLHPKDAGYAMMANAWYAKIQEIVPDPTACGGVNTPAVVDAAVTPTVGGTRVSLTFNQPMDAEQLADAATWQVTGASAPWTATASNDGRSVVFAFSPADFGQAVTIAATGLRTAEAPQATCDLARGFTLLRAAGIENNVPAADRAGYELVYDIDIPVAAKYQYSLPAYAVDNHAKIGAFSRVAYYLELQKPDGDVQYVWAAMDAFTDDAGRIGVPTGWTFQKDVSNLFLQSNVAGLRTNETIATGNIEFWPYTYKPKNARGLAGATDDLFDHDDSPDGPGSYYGSMQVHDTERACCVFAWNRWASGTDACDVGIGASAVKPTATDWTQSYNTRDYTLRHLQVYALPAAATTPPTVVSATRDAVGRRITVTFSMPVVDGSLAACFALKGGRVTKVARSDEDYSVVFIDYVPDGAEPELTIAGVHEASCALLPMAGAVTVKPAVQGVPQEVADLVGADLTAGYDVLYKLDIPATHVNWLTAENGHTAVPYAVSREDYPANVDRVAYLMELRGNGGYKWVWVSMDAFSPDVRKFGVPISADRAAKQAWVKNMDVKSNVAGIVNGTNMDGGFIEFWHMNYSNPNAFGVPGASDNTYDFGDSMTPSGGFGCMQVHSVTNRQTLFAFNNFGTNNSEPSCLGIGNDTYKTGNGVNPDWTFHYTAGEYTFRRLWVFVRPGAPRVEAAPAPAAVAANVPDAANFNLLYTLEIPASGMMATNPARYAAYHTVDNRAKYAGAKPSRVAYYLELVKPNGETNWCWTAFNGFTDDLARYSLPTKYAELVQQRVSGLDVRSNVPGVTEVTDCGTGNVEFFPLDYGTECRLGLAGAKGDQYDFDDTPRNSGGHGCMQVHNWGAKQTCWALSHLNNSGQTELGIGNYSATRTDWTLISTGASYASRRLHVFVRFDAAAADHSPAPSIRRIVAARDGAKVCVAFTAEPSAEWDAALYEIAAVRNGATVKSVARSPFDPREYILTLTCPLPAGETFTLKGTVPRASGDVAFTKTFTTPAAAFAAPHLTAENIPELGDYRLVNEFAFPGSGVSITANGADYTVDESRFGVGPFDRVAYYLELEGTNGVTQWAWASMDAFTADASKLGLPTVQRDIFFQRYVENLTVRSGAEGTAPAAVAGSFARGNIEIWPCNYSEPAGLGIPGGSSGVFDFDDTPAFYDGLHVGHGCLQVHDCLNGRSVIAISCLNGTPALGIGSDTVRTSAGLHPDWTHHSNAAQFRARRFYVFVRPTVASTGAAFDREPADATLDVGGRTSLTAHALGAAGYRWLVDGAVVPGATGPVLNLADLAAGAHTVQAVAIFADGSQTLGRTTTITVAWPEEVQTQTIRIMPLGDSITQGVVGDKSGYKGGYRRKLYEKLVAANYRVDFVGSTTADSGDMADPQHEGHSGWWITHAEKGLYENILKWSAGILNPHVVLMLIGTNDTGDGELFKTKIDALDRLIDRVAEAHPGAYIIVSPLLERGGTAYDNIQTYFNPFVRDRVLGHQLKGQKVRFWDVASYVPLADMGDKLHPGEVGYEKMAQGWFDAITDIWPTPMAVAVDNTPGILSFTVDQETRAACTVAFNTPLDAATATDAANWSITDGAVAGVSLSSDARTATVSFAAPLAADAAYTLTVTGVMDAARTAAMPATARAFYLSIPQGVANHVPAEELAQYEQIYSLEILPRDTQYDQNTVKYQVDNHRMAHPFKRVAYYLELRRPNANLQYVWVSMDAFTDDAGKIGLPTRASQAMFQQKVTNLKVWSNVEGVASGERAEGSIEFWPNTYERNGVLGLGGDDTDFDFDDRPTTGNYGSFQVHDFLNKATIFAYNRWGGNANSAADLGIGTCPRRGATTSAGRIAPDWTFGVNAEEYEVRHLEVWAMPDVQDATPPAPVAARVSASGLQMLVMFDSPLAEGQSLAGAFTLEDGTQVLRAEFIDDERRTVRLTLAGPVAPGARLVVAGLRDASPAAAKMAEPVLLEAADATPAHVKANVGELMEGYRLVYDLAVPVKGDFNARGAKMYDLDDSAFFEGNYDRVGYYFELVKANLATQYVWVSFAPHVMSASRLGVPLKSLNCYFQQYVEHMDVKSNVAGITSGTDFPQGNIEMWPTDYSAPNALSMPNASASNYDWGDTRSTGGSHGSFQVHNAGQRQVLFAINNWGADGNVLSIGVGNNNYGSGVDWTFANNAGNFVSRRVLVFARPCAAAASHPAPEAVAARVADAAAFEHVYTVDIPVKPKFSDAAASAQCHVVNNRTALEKTYMGAAPKRLAYFLELVDATGATNWVWTAMDAFTNTLAGISIPSGYVNWRTVSNLDVESNVPGVRAGKGIKTGNIEFCRYNYTAGTRLGLGGSASAFDFDDTPGTSGAYGCMQVHDHGARMTLWAINNFNTQDGNGVCIGIGNCAGSNGNTDYTHVFNGANWASRRLYVFALWNMADVPSQAASFRRATADAGLEKVCCTFDAALDAAQAARENFTCPGAEIVRAEVSPVDARDVTLTLGGRLAADADGSVTYRDPVSGEATTKTFRTSPAERPAVLAEIDESADYVLVNMAEIPTSAAWSYWGADYTIDASRFGGMSFDRIAYCLELVGTNGVRQWAWTSMDAFTADLALVGVPSVQRGIFWQQYVTDLHVRVGSSGAAPDVAAGDFARGNIEFWPGNYVEGNQKNIPGADGKTFDFGDTANADARNVGYGSMQVHATDQGRTVWAFNSFGSSNGMESRSDPCLGIGNCPVGTAGIPSNAGRDWTHVHNSREFTVRRLYALVRPSVPSGTAPADAFLLQPQSGAVRVGSPAFTLTAYAIGATGYQWFRDGESVPGATSAWCEIEPIRAGTHRYQVAATLADGTTALSEVATVTVFNRSTVITIR